jgi:3D (Asp-Asp-Asp) domain-containing protein
MKRLLVILLAGWAGSATAKSYTVTAYCPCVKCCGAWAAGRRTASGVVPKAGVTIAAPRHVPFGTRLYVEGVGWRVVQDRLAKRYDNRLDVFVNNHHTALAFGKQRKQVLGRK